MAFLDMLAWSEETDNGRQATKDCGYDVIVGGQLFNGYADDPRVLVDLLRLEVQQQRRLRDALKLAGKR